MSAAKGLIEVTSALLSLGRIHKQKWSILKV